MPSLMAYNSELAKWMRENDVVCDPSAIGRQNKRDVSHATHLFMDGFAGGGMIVPPKLEDEFLQKFAGIFAKTQHKKEQYQEKHYIIEKRTPIFKMCLDMDIQRNKEVDPKTIEDYCVHIQKVFEEFYPALKQSPKQQEEVFTLIILRTEPKMINGHDMFSIMTGVRVICPNLYVDDQKARQMCRALVG